MKYEKATDETLKLVHAIADKYHRRLDGAKIAVVMRPKASTSRGRKTMATASRPSPKMKPLLDQAYSFVITIAQDSWDCLNVKQRKALIDHELCHCEFDDKMEPSLRGHDLEEFAEIIERHGFWREDRGEQVVQEALITQGIEVGTLR